MKTLTPRFQSAVMTAEDWDVWHFMGCTSNDAGLGTIDFYELADRRDADIMRSLGVNFRDRVGWERDYPGVWAAAHAYFGLALPSEFWDAIEPLVKS